MATATDLERVVRKVLNEGTGAGQKSWAGTSKATLASIQHLHNLLRQQVIPRLPLVSTPQTPAPSLLSDVLTPASENGAADGAEGDEPSEIVIPAPALTALEELYLTLTPEQAGALAGFFTALSAQEEPAVEEKS
jgi:hypothetical protein